MFRAPLALSLQPIASITVFAAIWKSPSVRFIAVTILSFDPFSDSSPVEISMTIVFSLYSMPSSLTSLINLPAYSGPVSSSLKVCRPKPLCIHWFNMPPSSQSLSSKVHVAQNPSVVSDSSRLWTELIRQFMQDASHLMTFVCT